MTFALQIGVYAALLLLLTFGGNWACRIVLRLSATKTPPETGETISLRAGRTIGQLERVLIFIGLIASSWEIIAAVVALKTVARYRKLDDQNNAEYFLVGSLASILWGVLVTLAIVAYDKSYGLAAIPAALDIFGVVRPS